MNNAVLLPVEKALNYYLSLDEQSSRLLMPLINKIIVIELYTLKFPVAVTFEASKVTLTAYQQEKVDLYISGSLPALLSMIKSTQKNLPFFSTHIEIRGNVELAEQVSHLFKSIQVDWEEILAKFIGDPLANMTGRVFNRFTSWIQQSCDTLNHNLKEYLQEESCSLPSKDEVTDFLDQVDILRSATDRLQARINQVKGKLRSNAT